jgi:hypothetical protein
MKSTRRRTQQQAPSGSAPDFPKQGGVTPSGEDRVPRLEIKPGIYVIAAASSPYAPRPRRGPIEYAQGAIAALYPNGIPHNLNVSDLRRRVNKYLDQDPSWRAAGHKPVPRSTILRALKELEEANVYPERRHAARAEADRRRAAARADANRRRGK